MIEGLTLSEYLLAKEVKYPQDHRNCRNCEPMIRAGKMVLESKVIPLSYLWNTFFDGIAYDSEKARRRLLQMPLAAITVTARVYIVEKNYIQGSAVYESVKTRILSNHSSQEINYTSREDYKLMLHYAAQSESERELLRRTICSSYNLLKQKASKLYGISNLKKRSVKVSAASKMAKEIQDRNAALAKEEKKAFLLSCGIEANKIVTSTPGSDSAESDSSYDTEVSLESVVSESDGETVKCSDEGDEAHGVGHHLSDTDVQQTDAPGRSDCHRDVGIESNLKNQPAIDVNSVIVLEKLREVSWNWFAFVTLL